MPQPRAKVKLEDLDDGARALLLAELAQQQDQLRDSKVAEQERLAARRQSAIAALLDDRDHLKGCPGGRVEAYEGRRPPKPSQGIPAVDVTVVRCIECGGSTVLEQHIATTNAAIDQAVAEAADDD